VGCHLVRRGTTDRRDVSLAPRVGVHAAWFGRLLRHQSRRFSCRGNPAPSCGKPDDHSCMGRVTRLGLVRGRAGLRQRAVAASLDGDRPGNANAGLRRCWIEVAALADDAANGIGRSFPAGWHRRLRRAAATSPRLRSTTRRSHGLDRCLPHGLEGRGRCGVENHRNAHLRVVFSAATTCRLR